MKIAYKLLVVVIVLQILAFSTTAHAGLLPSSSATRSAGCHEHGQKSPLPSQKTYVCCLSGHDSLLLQPSTIVAPSSDCFLSSATPDPVIAGACLERGTLQVFSDDPPINTALRI